MQNVFHQKSSQIQSVYLVQYRTSLPARSDWQTDPSSIRHHCQPGDMKNWTGLSCSCRCYPSYLSSFLAMLHPWKTNPLMGSSQCRSRIRVGIKMCKVAKLNWLNPRSFRKLQSFQDPDFFLDFWNIQILSQNPSLKNCSNFGIRTQLSGKSWSSQQTIPTIFAQMQESRCTPKGPGGFGINIYLPQDRWEKLPYLGEGH